MHTVDLFPGAAGRPQPSRPDAARLTLEEKGGGGGSGTQKFVHQKWADQIFPTVNFVISHDGHFGSGGGGGSRGAPLMVVGRSTLKLLLAPSGPCHAPCATLRPLVVSLRGPGRSPVLPFAECAGSALSAQPQGGRVLVCLCGTPYSVCCGCGWCPPPPSRMWTVDRTPQSEGHFEGVWGLIMGPLMENRSTGLQADLGARRQHRLPQRILFRFRPLLGPLSSGFALFGAIAGG